MFFSLLSKLLSFAYARFLGRALLAADDAESGVGAQQSGFRRTLGPGGPASVSEAGGPGLGSSLALRCVSARFESFLFSSLFFPQVLTLFCCSTPSSD